MNVLNSNRHLSEWYHRTHHPQIPISQSLLPSSSSSSLLRDTSMSSLQTPVSPTIAAAEGAVHNAQHAANGDHRHQSLSTDKHESTFHKALVLLGYVSAIYVCYLYYGVLQEDIQHGNYKSGADEKQVTEKYDYSWFLVFIQCIVNGLFALLLCKVTPQPVDRVPKVQYFKIAFSYIFAMFSSNASLAYVSYPTQALAKCCKLIPVMFSRIIINRVRYKLREYLNVLMITAGISIFMLWTKSKEDTSSTSLIGALFLMASLALDAYTGPAQEKTVEQYKISANQMQLWLNFFAVAIVAVALVVTGEGHLAVAFCMRHPSVMPKILLFALCSAVGQAVVCRTFATTKLLLHFTDTNVLSLQSLRNRLLRLYPHTPYLQLLIMNVLMSVVLFGHKLNSVQWIGVLMVFTSLFLDMYWKNQKKGKHSKPHHG